MQKYVVPAILIVGLAGLGWGGYKAEQRLEAELKVGLTNLTQTSSNAISGWGGAMQKQLDVKVTPVTTQATATLKQGQELLKQGTGLVADARKKLEPIDLTKVQNGVTTELADADKLTLALADTTLSMKDTVAAWNEDLKPFTECAYYDADGTPVGGNPDCAFNRFMGSSKAIEKAMQSLDKMIERDGPKIADAAAETSASVASAANSLDIEAKALTKPQTKLQAIRTWLVALAKIYGSI